VTPAGVLRLVRDLRARVALPLVLLSYYNPILQYGPDRFCAAAAAAGADGVVVPDLPPEEAGDLMRPARAADLDVIFLVSPTSTETRIRVAAGQSSGFVYGVSLTGVTGVRERVSGEVGDLVRRIRQHTTLPVCVGFGVSTPEQAGQVAAAADGVIVGSAIVAYLEARGVAGLEEFVSGFRAALDGGRPGRGPAP